MVNGRASEYAGAARVPTSAQIQVRAIEDLDALRGLEAAHGSLFASGDSPHIGCAFPYVIADAATGSADRPWQLLAAWRGGQLAGCLYGRRQTRTVLRRSVPVFQLGPHFVADPLVGRSDEDGVMRELLDGLLRQRRDCATFHFPRLSEASFERIVRAAQALRVPWRWQWSRYGYAFDTSRGVDEFLAGMDGRKRRELNRRGRRLAKAHACDLECEEALGIDADMARFEEFTALEDSGWKGEQGTSIRRRPGYAANFRELVASASRAGMLRWYTLRADGSRIAMYLALRTHDTLWTPKIGYDERFAEHAPGLLLKHRLLMHSIADPAIRRVDNISGAPWVQLWKPMLIPFRSLTLFGLSPLSRILHRAAAGRTLVRRISGRADSGPGPGDHPYL